jgi:outer membrane protein assembly factor BamB
MFLLLTKESPIMRFASIVSIVLLGAAFALSLKETSAEDWSRFRGPNGSGVAENADPPLTWDDTENIQWKAELPGPGASSPILSDGRVFLTCYSGYGESSESGETLDQLMRHLVCIDQESGDVLWTVDVEAVQPEDLYSGIGVPEHGYASNSPVVDGDRVYAFFAKSGVKAYDFEGNELWATGVGKDSGSRRWGSAASLILYKDLVIVNAEEESLSIRALDKATGEERWKVDSAKLEMAYMTPILAETEDGRTELIVAVQEEVWGFDPDTGECLWWIFIPMDGNISPSPITADGVIYLSGGYRTKGTVAMKPGGTDDATDANLIWSVRESTYVPTPVYNEDRLYWINEQGIATCLNSETGEVVYQERIERTQDVSMRGNRFYGSPVLTGDRIYIPSRFEGTFVYAVGDEFKLLAQNRFTDDTSRCGSTPAIDGDTIYLRTDRFLYRIESSGATE